MKNRPLTVIVAGLLAAALVLGIGLPFILGENEERSAVASTVDVQEFDQLWRAIQSLQEQAPELGPDEFTNQVVARTAEFLVLDARAEAEFRARVHAALDQLRRARARIGEVNLETRANPDDPDAVRSRRAAWGTWQQEQRAAADGLADVLAGSPRHRLLAEKRLLWLLRLDYSVQPAPARQR